MALGGEVDDGARRVPGQQAGNEFTVADVALQAGQGFEVAGVGEFVKVEDRLL